MKIIFDLQMNASKVALIFVASLAASLNLHALFFLCKRKHKSNYTILCINLAFSDIVKSLLGFTLSIFLNDNLEIPTTLCKISGFFIIFPGLASISLLASIAFTRLLLVNSPFLTNSASYKAFFRYIPALAWIYAFFWSVLPLIGVSSYTVDVTHTCCSIKWIATSSSEKIYVILLILFCYVTPTIMILISSLIMATCIHKKFQLLSQIVGMRNAEIQIYKSRENKAKLSLTLMSFSFIACWTPYTIISLLSAYTSVRIPIYMHRTGSVFAKLSAVFNPIIIYWRRDVLKMLRNEYLKSRSTFVLSIKKIRTQDTHF